jgi:hypothetical protein
MSGGSKAKAALWASAAGNTLSTGTGETGDCDCFCYGDALVSLVILLHSVPLTFLKAQYYRYRRLR